MRCDGRDARGRPRSPALDFPPGTVHAFVHGEASSVREIRATC